MTEFLAENNACGQNLLHIVSMGNAIIAEILRLKDCIPDVYNYETKAELQKYSEIIMDFSYLKVAEVQELKIEQNAELQDLDDEIRINYLSLLTRFYLAFESTHQYAADLKQYLHELSNGYYIQHTMESVLQDAEGKQLMCEALYLFGVILLMMDYHIPGIIRERLLISYYRYSAAKSHGDSAIDDVCMLLRSTGFLANGNTTANSTHIGKQAHAVVANYPEAYFARFHFEQDYIDMVIGRLRCDDVYNQLAVYPHPEHRSTALSTQASMLFVCLFFSPQVLHAQVSQMREIVDKFFSDNWIVSIEMGMTVSLMDAWHNFKAAKSALSPVLEANVIKSRCLLHYEKMQKTLRHTNEILREGVLNDDFVLQNVLKIIVLIRQCNVLLRWYWLHSTNVTLNFAQAQKSTEQQQAMQLVRNELKYDEQELFELLLNTSQLELVVKDILRQLMLAKSERWIKFRSEAAERLVDLSMAFSGTFSLTKIEPNPELKKWFSEINKHVNKLSVDAPSESGRIIIQLIHTLEEVQEFHNLRSNMQVKQHLQEACEYLQRLMQIINVREDLLINLQIISDLSYAWQLLDRDFTGLMQLSIKRQPRSVIRLRAVFLKLASALETPLLRINQAKSEDLISVSKYYSNELANCMRKVLQIIPESIFSLLSRIISLQTDVIKEIPTRLEKDKIKEYAQFDDRFKISKLTHSIAVFTEGILMMQKTLVGVIELDPKQLLEDGIRKELVNHLSSSLNLALIFTANKTHSLELDEKLLLLAKTMDGYKRSFEYIQDYLNVQGLKILQQELCRVVNYNVEKECNMFLRNKVQEWQSQYQSQTIPIPNLPAIVGDISKSNNFIGRLAYQILQHTEPKETIYLQLKGIWYDKRAPHREMLDARLFAKLREAIGPVGLVGLDRFYSHMIVNELKHYVVKLERNLTTDPMWLTALNSMDAEFPETRLVSAKEVSPQKRYLSYAMRWQKVWPQILHWIMSIGQKQLLRQQLANELNRSSKCHSKNLESALESFNRALISTIRQQQQQRQHQKQKQVQSAIDDAIETKDALLIEINQYAIFTGTFEPMEQVFLLLKCPQHLALFLFLFTIAHLSRLQFSANTNSLLPKVPKDSLDCLPLTIGLLTVLQQFNAHVCRLYLNYMCHYVTMLIESNMHIKTELSADTVTTLHFLEDFISIAKLPRSILIERIPEMILNRYQYLATNE